MYYNTNNESGSTLKESTEKAKTQEEFVLDFFQNRNHLGVTPERCLRHFQICEPLTSSRWARTPITSIRRCFSNLKDKGLIERTENMTMGEHGKNINIWRLKR